MDVTDFTDELTETCVSIYENCSNYKGLMFTSTLDEKNQFRKYKNSPVSDVLATKDTNLNPDYEDQELYMVPQEETAYQINCYKSPSDSIQYDHLVQLEVRFSYGKKGYQCLSICNSGNSHNGSITRFIFLMKYAQTGYEGHNRTTRDLTEDDCEFLHGELDYLRSLDWS